MIYVTGDTHGQIDRFKEKPVAGLKKGDTLIVLGDFGFLWDDSRQEKKNRHWLSKRRYKILFIDGCHENFDLLAQYPTEDFMGGKAKHIEGNLWYILRGSVLTIEDKKLLCFGGGESDDIEDRDEGLNWWRAELPTPQELDACRENLRASGGGAVDYILTHEAPGKVLDFLGLQGLQRNWLHSFLDELNEKTPLRKLSYHKIRGYTTLLHKFLFPKSILLLNRPEQNGIGRYHIIGSFVRYFHIGIPAFRQNVLAHIYPLATSLTNDFHIIFIDLLFFHVLSIVNPNRGISRSTF